MSDFVCTNAKSKDEVVAQLVGSKDYKVLTHSVRVNHLWMVVEFPATENVKPVREVRCYSISKVRQLGTFAYMLHRETAATETMPTDCPTTAFKWCAAGNDVATAWRTRVHKAKAAALTRHAANVVKAMEKAAQVVSTPVASPAQTEVAAN